MSAAPDRRVVTVFRSRLRPNSAHTGYDELASRMEARARSMPGFVDFKQFVADDGERVSIIVFDTIAHQTAWRDDPEHLAAQRQGREHFYREYSISVCDEYRSSVFSSDGGSRAEGQQSGPNRADH